MQKWVSGIKKLVCEIDEETQEVDSRDKVR